MKKKIVSFALAATMLLSSSAMAVVGNIDATNPENAAPVGPVVPSANEQGKGVYVREVMLDKLTVTNEDGVTLLPLRVIAEAFDFGVEWDQPAQTVTIKTEDDEIKLTIGNKAFTSNGGADELDAAPMLIDWTTYVSHDFITKALNFKVDFDGWRISVDSKVDLRNADATLELSTGDTFTIGLEENTTTGFAWSYAVDKAESVSLVTEDIDVPELPEGMAGAPSFHIWEMKAEKAGTYTLTFTYDRSFSPSENPTTYTYTIIVK